jgi:hypothetical protein
MRVNEKCRPIDGPYFDRPLGYRARAGHGGYGLLDPIDSAYKRVGFLSMKLFQAAKDAASAQNAEKTQAAVATDGLRQSAPY